ncbi:hypothetical protein BH11MYX2_BH11MYX2_31570 [soil metagenome]
MRLFRPRAWLLGTFGSLTVTACLQVPNAPKHECESTPDCDRAHGEVCEDGTCWGDPPTDQLTYLVSPPAEHTELVPLELTDLRIDDDGRLPLITFEQPISFSGRLDVSCVMPMLCDAAKLNATVTVSRESLFAGGPGFRTVSATTASTDGAAFSIKVPPFRASADYAITIVPQPRSENDPNSLAQLVPPLHRDVKTLSDIQKALTLGALDLEHIEGTLLASSGSGLANYRVVAMGRWEENSAPTEVSTVAFTGSDGSFRLFISKDAMSPTEIVASPADPTSVAPTLRLPLVQGAFATLAGQTTLSQPPNLGSPRPKMIHITARDGGGNEKDIVGARVRVGAKVPTPDGGTAEIYAEANTDDGGIAMLSLLDGAIAQEFTLDVVPPASATVGAIYAQPYSSDSDGKVQLPTRVRLRGHVVDSMGEKLAGVSVTARPSYRFAWNLDADAQTFLSSISVSTAVTNDSGEYVVWVDPALAGISATYDLSMDPARSTGTRERAPSYTESDIAIGQNMANDSITVNEIRLPDAAFVHGNVIDPVGTPIENAEVKVFRQATDYTSICSSSQHAPTPCPVHARLLGRGAANATGTVELTLPRE